MIRNGEGEPVVHSRRAFLATAVIGGVGLEFLLTGCGEDSAQDNNTQDGYHGVADPFCDRPEAGARDESEYGPVFADLRAEKVAERLHINPGSYFKLNGDAIEKVNDSGEFRHRSWVAPIFPPAVMKFEKEIIAAAEESDIPASILASLATIESAGRTNAVSGADAHGLVQVVPRYHRNRIDEIAGKKFSSDQERSDYLRDNPAACLRVGASYYAECVKGAKQLMPKLRPDSMVIFARAAAAYNGGPARAGQDFMALPLESKLYVNHVARLTLDVEIAAKLAKQGLDDHEILRAMQSLDINARAMAYDNMSRGQDFQRYEDSAATCATPTPGVDPESGEITDPVAKKIYKSYINDCKTANPWTAPAVPGLRIWLVGGGDSLFLSVPENANWRLPKS